MKTLRVPHRNPARALWLCSRGVIVIDGSRRSAHGNAYFTGVGRNKRIVFFDTLINTLEPAEIEAVLAHELGHFKLHQYPPAAGRFRRCSRWPAWPCWAGSPRVSGSTRGLGLEGASDYGALLLFMFVAPGVHILRDAPRSELVTAG